MLRRATLLALARRCSRGLGMLRVRVQGSAGVGVLLGHWLLRHCETDKSQNKCYIEGKVFKYCSKQTLTYMYPSGVVTYHTWCVSAPDIV